METNNRGLKTLRVFANKTGLKITSVDGIKVIMPNGTSFVYKQSSEDLPIGSKRPDWIEDLNGKMIMNPFEINKIDLGYNIKVVVGKDYYDLTLDDIEHPTVAKNFVLEKLS